MYLQGCWRSRLLSERLTRAKVQWWAQHGLMEAPWHGQTIYLHSIGINLNRPTMYAAGPYNSGGKVTGEKGPVTELKLGTYALMWSFSHASHRDRWRSLISHHPYVPVCPQLRSLKTHALRLALVGCNGSMLSRQLVCYTHRQYTCKLVKMTAILHSQKLYK